MKKNIQKIICYLERQKEIHEEIIKTHDMAPFDWHRGNIKALQDVAEFVNEILAKEEKQTAEYATTYGHQGKVCIDFVKEIKYIRMTKKVAEGFINQIQCAINALEKD